MFDIALIICMGATAILCLLITSKAIREREIERQQTWLLKMRLGAAEQTTDVLQEGWRRSDESLFKSIDALVEAGARLDEADSILSLIHTKWDYIGQSANSFTGPLSGPRARAFEVERNSVLSQVQRRILAHFDHPRPDLPAHTDNPLPWQEEQSPADKLAGLKPLPNSFRRSVEMEHLTSLPPYEPPAGALEQVFESWDLNAMEILNMPRGDTDDPETRETNPPEWGDDEA